MGPLDLLLLGTLGIGTLIWLSRKLRSTKSYKYDDTLATKGKAEQSKAANTGPERNFVKLMQQQNRQVIFFYGSQTGTAEDYASRLAKECSQKYGVSCMAADIELYDMTFMDSVPSENLVVFVMATYGEGEPTDNAVDFWELLTSEEPEFSESSTLENLRYIVFGLGNKTYEHYNSVSRILDSKLTELGAKRLGERGEGDDDASLEEDFLAWQEGMWPVFCEAMGVDESSAQSGPRQAMFSVQELDAVDRAALFLGELGEWTKPEQLLQQTITHDAKHPYQAPIAVSRDLFTDSADRHCLHLEIDLSKSNMSYQTGDHIAIWPTNNEIEVHRLAAVLGLSDKLDTAVMVEALDNTASKKHPFPVPTTYRALFRHYLDICAPASRQTLMTLVEYAPTESSKEALRQLASDKDVYRLKVGDAIRNLAEVLELCQDDDEGTTTVSPGFFSTVPFDLIIESVSRLQPRYYSISSSSSTSPKSVAVTAVTLSYQPTKEERTVYGVNTNYLWRIHSPEDNSVPYYDLNGPRNTLIDKKVPVHIRRSPFKLPRNTKLPVIMVGPGTGVAPFRGFVHERVYQKQQQGKEVGPTVLFYGCRHPSQDFLYKEEWPQLFEALGEDSRLITAFSRETDRKVYVQHRLKEHGEQMWQYIEQGAYIYVCGDAKNMARDVQQTFVQFAQSFGQRTEQQAQDYVKNLRSSGRYQEDVWS
ncbi:hypothetical protein BDB00DRAFT_772242 [Zychaea mexicana]|uniref:uncharacterized protein n=1 Tax=Zychaea mexicana TaxID=64656 RepID=UPI0022FE08BC|nr:uncharacterized protein BDB00DRAFT_772242 [Zychaea mexicana]KAI9488586.1 hypothetical protein BDB00DRAFT_772242 [Zychaea mexicana]